MRALSIYKFLLVFLLAAFGRTSICLAQTNDPEFYKQWALTGTAVIDIFGTQFEVPAPGFTNAIEAWNIRSDCYPIVIGILSTGVDVGHPDLVGSFVSSAYYRNFTVTPANSDITDRYGNGTVLSGLIAARSNNDIGITGACKSARLLPIKIAGDNNALNWDAIAKGINYASTLGVRIMLIPQGDIPSAGDSQALRLARQRAYDAILAAELKGQLIIVPAKFQSNLWPFTPGSNLNTNADYPTRWGFSNIITVTGSDVDGEVLGGASFGSNYADIAAPGDVIRSTMSRNFRPDLYADYNGTDLSAAYVAAEAALVWSQNRAWDYAKVRQQIIATAKVMSGVSGKVRSNGVADFYQALSQTNVAPANKADLKISSFSTSTGSQYVYVNEAVILPAQLRNDGPVSAGPFNLVLTVDGNTVYSQRISGLAANTQLNKQVGPIPLASGLHNLKLVVDIDREVVEANEANNVASMSVTALISQTPTPAPK
jgi:subtilisin family serine protease